MFSLHYMQPSAARKKTYEDYKYYIFKNTTSTNVNAAEDFEFR